MIFVRGLGGLIALLFLCLVIAGCTEKPHVVIDGSSPRPIPSAPPSSRPVDNSLKASPYIVFAGVDAGGASVSVSGAVGNVLEEGGSCTFRFSSTSGAAIVNATSTGHSESNYTTCGVAQVSIDQFTSGTWTVELEYTSGPLTVSSARQIVEIP